MRHPVHPRPAFPASAGVYIWRRSDEILYIGKAKRLANRLRSYYQTHRLDPKTAVLMRQVDSVEWIEVETEEQALLLEAELIKRHRPPYNIRLKDDKHYPYVAITDDRYPRVIAQHRTSERQWRYYGPYSQARELRAAVAALNAVFLAPLWGDKFHRRGNPPVPRERWMQEIAKIEAILEGKHEWLAEAEIVMRSAADKQNYEYAAKVRDWIKAMEYLQGRRSINSAHSYDVLGWEQNDEAANLQILQLRAGKLVGRRSYTTEGGSCVATILEAYRLDPPPAKLYMLKLPGDHELVAAQLGRPFLAARGQAAEFARMAQTNAHNTLNYVLEHEKRHSPLVGVRELEKALALKGLSRIECYDISNLGDRHPVGAVAVMIDGIARRRMYRKWSMEKGGQDDFTMMHELVARRLAGVGGSDDRTHDLPDLMVIDGGKGQLGAALSAIKESGHRVAVISLAKRLEEVFLPGHVSPLHLPTDSAASLMLQQLRDETHNAAIGFHRAKRDAAALHGDFLSDVRGLGPARHAKLLTHFGSVEHVLEADIAELELVLGPKVAEIVHRQLHR